MRILLRLATFCLSLVLLTGVLAHDLAAANMSMETSGMTASSASDEGEACAACLPGEQSEVICDIDCTAPVFIFSRMHQSPIESVQRFFMLTPADLSLAGLNPGSDPFPPRTTFLS